MRQLYAKIIDLAGTTVARLSPVYDGETDAIEYTEVACINGEDVIGTATVNLKKVTDPAYMYQRDIQRAIKKHHRIELYSTPDFRGTPDWSGVVVGNPSDGTMRLDCEDASARLKRRYMRHDDLLNGNAATVAQGLLQTHKNIVMWDDFATNLDKWTTTTGWTIGSGIISAAPGADLKSDEKAEALCTDVQLWIDVKIPENGSYSFYFPYRAASENYYQIYIVSSSASFGELMQVTISTVHPGVTTELVTRYMLIPCDEWLHLVLRYSVSGTTQTVGVDWNDTEIISVSNTDASMNTTGAFYMASSGTGDNYYADNFLWLSKAAALSAGTFDVSAVTLTNQETMGMSYRDTFNWIANRLGWEWRINPRAGEGNDTVDFRQSVGYNWGNKFIFKETEDAHYPFRIVACQKTDTTEELCTALHTYGQRSDDMTSGFVSVNLAAMATYGVLEGEYSDERIIDVSTGKVIGDIELAKRSSDTPSYSFTLLDESRLYDSGPLRAGDVITVTSESMDLFEEDLEILSLRRYAANQQSIDEFGTGERVDVVCEYQPWTRRNLVNSLQKELAAAYKALYLKMDTQSLTFALSGTTAQTQSFSLRGNYRSVLISVHSGSWAGNITSAVDGVDRTNRWFGAANIGANRAAKESTLSFITASLAPGVHTLTLTPTQTVTVRVDIIPQVQLRA